MAADNKIAEEHLSTFNKFRYTRYYQYISDCDGISLEQFKNSPMGARYWIDVHRCFVGNKLNPDHLPDIFCVYSGTDPATLRS